VLRWTTVARTAQQRPGGPTGADQGRFAVAVRRHGRLNENVVLNLKNKSHAVTAEVVLPDRPANGTIVDQGGSSAAGRCTPDGGSSTATTCWHQPLLRRIRFRAASGNTRCVWSSPTTARAGEGWERDALPGRQPDRRGPCRPDHAMTFSVDETRMWAGRPHDGRRGLRRPGQQVQRPDQLGPARQGPERLRSPDHPEQRLHLAMTRQ